MRMRRRQQSELALVSVGVTSCDVNVAFALTAECASVVAQVRLVVSVAVAIVVAPFFSVVNVMLTTTPHPPWEPSRLKTNTANSTFVGFIYVKPPAPVHVSAHHRTQTAGGVEPYTAKVTEAIAVEEMIEPAATTRTPCPSPVVMVMIGPKCRRLPTRITVAVFVPSIYPTYAGSNDDGIPFRLLGECREGVFSSKEMMEDILSVVQVYAWPCKWSRWVSIVASSFCLPVSTIKVAFGGRVKVVSMTSGKWIAASRLKIWAVMSAAPIVIRV
jgi:hypothetical protein